MLQILSGCAAAFMAVYWNYQIHLLLTPEQQAIVTKNATPKLNVFVAIFGVCVIFLMPPNWYRFGIFVLYLLYNEVKIYLADCEFKKLGFPKEFLRQQRFYHMYYLVLMLTVLSLMLPRGVTVF